MFFAKVHSYIPLPCGKKMRSVFDIRTAREGEVLFSLNKPLERMGSICEPGECIDMSLAEYENRIGADCEVFPELCALWEEVPCQGVTALAVNIKECPTEYIWACRSNTKPDEETSPPSGEYRCRPFKQESASYFIAFSEDYWMSKEECDSNCKCSDKSYSGASGICRWVAYSDQYWLDTAIRCQAMTKGECDGVQTNNLSWGQGYIDAGGTRMLGGAIWSCEDSCGDCGSSTASCPAPSVLVITEDDPPFSDIQKTCKCEEPREKCGTYPNGPQWTMRNGYCKTCEFCFDGQCYSCNDVMAKKQVNNETTATAENAAYFQCPNQETFNEQCKCSDPNYGCDTCQFCNDGLCYDCGRAPDGEYWGDGPPFDTDGVTPINPDGMIISGRREKCSKFCQSPDRKVCLCTFRSRWDQTQGKWVTQTPTSSDMYCGWPSEATSFWEQSSGVDRDCNEKVWIKEIGECNENGCVDSSPASWQYPIPYYSSKAPSAEDCKLYICTNETCVEDENGYYLGLSECQNDCEKIYYCEWEQADGKYERKCKTDPLNPSKGTMSKAECETFSNCPEMKYSCKLEGTEITCEPDPDNGTYSKLEECELRKANFDCFFPFKCNDAGDGCVPVEKGTEGAFSTKYDCEQAIPKGGCSRYSCTYPSSGDRACEKDAYGKYASEEECKQNCCTDNDGTSNYPETIGCCTIYTGGILTAANKYEFGGLTRAECTSKFNSFKVDSSLGDNVWGDAPEWTCVYPYCAGTDSGFYDCPPDCPGGKYRVKTVFNSNFTSTSVCTCVG